MTYTSHGHHIPGTVDTDEGTLRFKMRCGGPNICKVCKEEAVKVLPDGLAKASLLNDLDALVVPEELLNPPVELMRRKIQNFGAMEFTGGEDSAFDIMSWLANNGVYTTYWPIAPNAVPFEGDEMATKERIEFMRSNRRVAVIYPGDWLVHGLRHSWDSSNPSHPVQDFDVMDSAIIERDFERSTFSAPVPWSIQVETVGTPNHQPELDAILALKKARQELVKNGN